MRLLLSNEHIVRKVLMMQDCGGQARDAWQCLSISRRHRIIDRSPPPTPAYAPVLRCPRHPHRAQEMFDLIRHLLKGTSGNSVDLLVVSLKALQADFEKHLATVRSFLNSLAVHAPSADADTPPRNILLVGTMKDQVSGGPAAVRELSKRLQTALRSCAAFPRVRYNEEEDMCLHAIENSRSERGAHNFDTSIQVLAVAIDHATDELPSMKELVPPAWLRWLDTAQREKRQHLTLDEARDIGASCGLPCAEFELMEELSAMLHFFHSLGMLLWFDTPELRTLVIVGNARAASKLLAVGQPNSELR